MNDITIITPPDILVNDAYSMLLIFPSSQVKTHVQTVLTRSQIPVNVFLYEDLEEDLEWLLKLIKMVNLTIIDVDHCDIVTRHFATHIIAQPTTFYLTNDQVTPYNLISKNRIYDLSWLESILVNRGNNAE